MLGLLVVTAALAAGALWLLDRRDRRYTEAEQAHRAEVYALAERMRQQFETLTESHRQEIKALHEARVAEVADLLQRIQAPEVATAEHAGRGAGPDPVPVDLEDDEQMVAAYKQRIDDYERELEAMQ